MGGLSRRRSTSAARRVILLFFLSLGIIACTPQADVETTRAPTSAGSLQPYQSPTPSQTPPSATLVPTQTPLPTATPHIYTVKSGDTMGSIALDFGLDMGKLVNANPDVSPYAMSIGQELLIPDGDVPVALPTLAPLKLTLSSPDCYATLSGGLWCFVLVQNNESVAVESVSAEVRLFNEAGKLLATEIAFPLQERLLVGEAQPLMVYFVNMSLMSHAQAELLTAFKVSDENSPYLSASLRSVLTQIAWDGSMAEVSGEVIVEGEPEKIFIVATAYSETDRIVGVRRWESVGEEREFNLTVASLFPEIVRISLSVEAHR